MKELKSELKDRKLRFDGVSEIQPGQLARFLLLGVPSSKLRVAAESEDLAEFNAQVSEKDQLKTIQSDPIMLDMSWQLPEEYQKLDLFDYFANKFEYFPKQGYTLEQMQKAVDRIGDELHEVETRGMVEFMRTVIYIIDQLRKNNVIWGVGRGSSCASYLLFLTGLHVVDCVIMDVSPDEFFHD